MKSWPAAGPTLLWSTLDLAKGCSSPSFGNNTIYITGNIGIDDILYALSMNGKILWKTVMDRARTGSNPESRATPTIESNKVYTCSGFGDLACIDGTTGKKCGKSHGTKDIYIKFKNGRLIGYRNCEIKEDCPWMAGTKTERE